MLELQDRITTRATEVRSNQVERSPPKDSYRQLQELGDLWVWRAFVGIRWSSQDSFLDDGTFLLRAILSYRTAG